MLFDVWLTMRDGNVCPQCAALDGTAWPTGSAHANPPAHPNCRCHIYQDDREAPMPEPWPIPPAPIPVPDRPDACDNDEDPEECRRRRREAQNYSKPTRLSAPLHLTLARTPTPRRYAVTLIAAGPMTGHRVTLPQEVLNRDWTAFALPGLTAFADHPDFLAQPKIDRILGTYHNVHLAGDRVNAELELAPTPIAAQLQPLLDLAANDPASAPNIGLSANVWAELEDTQDPRAVRPIARLTECESVDIVFRPASAPARLTHILATKGPHHMDEPLITPAPEILPAQPDPQSYLARLADATLTLALREARLPAASEEAIRHQFDGLHPTPEQIDTAITQQRQLISALSFSITGHDHPLDGGRITGMRNGLDDAQDTINWMFGVKGAPMPPPSLRRPAHIYGALTGDYEWHGTFKPQNLLFATANTTTLADLSVNAMNKIIIDAWDGLSEYRWFEDLVTVQPHDGSTQPMAWLSYGGIANLPVVAEGAAYTELSIADSKESDSFIKYGGYVGVTQEMLRKSDIARIQAIPRALAVAAVRTRSAAIAAIFTANSGVGPTLDDDSTALFHSNHGSNVQTTAFDIAAWKSARIECYKHTEAGSSKRLGFWPRYCLVPGDLYDTALIAFSYGSGPGGYPGTANNDVNPYAQARTNDARPIPIAVPDWTDTNDWAYLVDPRQHPVIQMSYVQAPGGGSHPQPEIYSVSTPTAGLTFTNDVLPIKVRDWFAYGVSTWRGIGKRNVT